MNQRQRNANKQIGVQVNKFAPLLFSAEGIASGSGIDSIKSAGTP
jgi:hypothetical protein